MKRLIVAILAVLLFVATGALAQGPNDLNAGSQLALNGTTGAYTFSWWGATGYTYLIETSDDLINWSYLPIVESGSDSAIEWGFTSNSSSLFMKLEYITVPADQLSGTALNGPLDSNGLPEDWELFYFGSLGIDPNVDPNGEGFTNLQDYENGNNPIANQVVSVGPCVGEYLFHETSGTTAHDISSIHNNGLLSGGADWSPTSGYDGQGAITFDGTSGAVTISDTGNLVLPAAGAPFSFSFWFQPNPGLTGTAVLMNAGTPGASGFQVGLDSSQSPPNLFFSTFGSEGTEIETPLLSASAAWTQVAVTYDGTNASIYVDGLEQISGTATLVSSTTAITLAMNGGGSQPFAGSMENLTFYQAVLQEPDVSCLYNISTTSTGPDSSAIANWWKYEYYGTLNVNPNAFVAWSGSTVTLLQAFEEGLDPIDFYDGQPPTLTLVSGTNQTGSPGGFVSAPLVIAVTDSNGNAIVGAPVSFTATSGTFQASSGGTPGTTVTAFTDKNGLAQMFFQLPPTVSGTSQITVSTGTGSTLVQVNFTASSDNGTGQFLSPFAPSDCLGTVDGNGNLVLTWDNNTDNETAIYIEQQQSGGSWSEIASVAPGTPTYTVMSPTPGSFRIDAQLPSGDPPSGPVFVPIPVQSYVAINVSGSTGASNVTMVALDDSNNAAFAYPTGSPIYPTYGYPDGQPSFYCGEYNTYVWSNGALGQDVVSDMSVLWDPGDPDGPPYPPYNNYVAASLDSQGRLYGTADDMENVGDEGSCAYADLFQSDTNGQITEFDFLPAQWNEETSGTWGTGGTVMGGCSPSAGFIYGSGLVIPYQPFSEAFSFIRDSSGNWTAFIQNIPDGAANPPNVNVQQYAFSITDVNDNGWAIGYSGSGDAAVWTGTTASALTYLTPMEGVTAINSIGQVVGVTGTSGYLWTSGSTTSVCPLVQPGNVQSILSLIPAPYQGRIQSINPIDISGTNATDGSVRILLSGTYQTDSSGDTAVGTFLLTLTSGTAAVSSGTAETIFQQVSLPSGFNTNLSSSGFVNSQGTIAVLGATPTSSGTSAILLFPLQLKNLVDPTQRNGAMGRDTQVSFLQSSTDTNINSVAWIAATDTNGTEDSYGYYPPRMPQLQANIAGLAGSGLTVCWRLSVINTGTHGSNGNPYRDFDNGTTLTGTQIQQLTNPSESGTVGYSDDIYVPFPSNSGDTIVSGSWTKVSGNAPWNIYEDADWVTARNRGFFGGDATLSVEVLDSNNNPVVSEQDYRFRIAGENPSLTSTTGAGYCQDYINTVCQGPNPNWNGITNSGDSWQALLTRGAWFGYAIAKEETFTEGGRRYYNQFFDNGGQEHAVPGKEGIPDWNNDGKKAAPGTGGYGLFQLTFQGGSPTHADPDFIMPRAWLWNWQANVQQFLPAIQQKIKYTHYFINYNQTQLSAVDPSGLTCTVDSTTLPFWDSSVITIYNVPSVIKSWTDSHKNTHTVVGAWPYNRTLRLWGPNPVPNTNDYLGRVVRIGMEGKNQ
jgi:hypothetical protein